MTDEVRSLLDDQIVYYRQRAPEYDATSFPADHPLTGEATRVAAMLRTLPRAEHALELAAGTGTWTRELVEIAARVTAVDASPEMLQINRAKVGSPKVEYVVADVFSFEPPRRYDLVFFGFWLSHVPLSRFDAFWDLVRRSLTPDGRVLFVDEGRHADWEEDWIDASLGSVRRRLRDGTRHRAVKVLWDAGELRARLDALGWEAEIRSTGAFYWGSARDRRPA